MTLQKSFHPNITNKIKNIYFLHGWPTANKRVPYFVQFSWLLIWVQGQIQTLAEWKTGDTSTKHQRTCTKTVLQLRFCKQLHKFKNFTLLKSISAQHGLWTGKHSGVHYWQWQGDKQLQTHFQGKYSSICQTAGNKSADHILELVMLVAE